MESPFRDAGLNDPTLRLIETLGWDGETLPRLSLHLARMADGAARFGWEFDPSAAEEALRRACGDTPLRLRLTLAKGGVLAVEASPMPAPVAVWRLGLAPTLLDPSDPWLSVKSTRRDAYDAARAALPEDIDEVVFLNPRGEVCDGTITTIFFHAGTDLCTPPLSAGLLPGVLRAELLASGACREVALRAEDLPFLHLFAGNSLRGLAPAVWVGDGA